MSSMPSTASTSFPPSEESRYEVLETLGTGGIGVVQRVKDHLLKREVALKTIKLKPQVWGRLSTMQQTIIGRLVREAEITATLEHPNIVPLYDLQRQDSGEIYFTMKKVKGETLRALLKRKQEDETLYEENRLLSLFLKVCDAISYAHSQGIIHRDLKPDNIMVGRFGEVYVMDWGVAKSIDAPSEKRGELLKGFDEGTWLQTADGIGTPGYMPPEQEKNANAVKPQADIFAMGVILRECYVLISPEEEFKQNIEVERKKRKLAKHKKKLAQPGSPSSSLEERIPTDIRAIINKAIQEDPEDRYPSLEAMAEDIENYKDQKRVSAKEYTLQEIIWKWLKRNWQWVLLSGSAIVICVLYLVYAQWTHRKEKIKKFEAFVTLAEAEQERAQTTEKSDQKIESLLKTMNYLNSALSLVPESSDLEDKKYQIGKALISLTCSSHDYELANYLVSEMNTLKSLADEEKLKLQQTVHAEQTKLLQHHQERLSFWLAELKKPTQESGTRELALLEISKMSEEEIWNELVKLLTEGTTYFLTSTQRTITMDLFYQTLVEALGRIGNPRSGELFLTEIQKMVNKLQQYPVGRQPPEELNYTILMAQGLGYTNDPKIAEKLQAIRLLWGQGTLLWDRTAITYQQLLRLTQIEKLPEDDAEAFLKRAEVKESTGDLAGALADYTEAIRLNPRYKLAYNFRGMIRLTQKDLQGALDDFNEMIRLDPNSYIGYNNRANVKQQMKQIASAIEDYNQATRINPANVSAYSNRGILKGENNDLDGAIADFTQVLIFQPQNAKVRCDRGETLLRKNDLIHALQDFEQTLRINPQFTRAYYGRASIRHKQGDYDAALQDYNQLLQIDPKFKEAYAARALSKQRKGDINGAFLDLNYAIQIDPQYADGYAQRGMIRYDFKQLSEAMQDFNRAIQLDPKHAQAHNNRGAVKEDMGDFSGAIEDYQVAARLDPQFGEPYNNLGSVKMSQGDIDGAIEAFTEAIRRDATCIEAYINRANANFGKGLYDGIIDDCNTVLAMNPRFPQAYYFRGVTKLKLNDADGALEDLELAIQILPNYSVFYHSRGVAKKAKGDLEEAILDFKKAIQLDSQMFKSHFYLGQIYATQKNVMEAKKEFDLAIEGNSQFAESYLHRAPLRKDSGDLKGALNDYEEALRLNPKLLEAPEIEKQIKTLQKQIKK